MARISGITRPTPAGGIPCPECGSFIVIQVTEVIAGRAIPCVACGVTLTVDAERSGRAVDALRQWVDGTMPARTFAQDRQAETEPPRTVRRRRPRPRRGR